MIKTKTKLLKMSLYLGALYYLIGAVAHYFGLTLFPWFDSRLYAPYHDTIIALVAVILALLLITVARNPVKNIDVLKFIIFSVIFGSAVSMAVIWKVDFETLGAPAKKAQTIVEGVLGFIYAGILLWAYPKHV